ncbi:hypothetical protein V1511DRAFT_444825, partial [Dipodascopsis uninucleata]
MALAPSYIGTFTAAEIAFIAENTSISIIPRQTNEKIDLIEGELPALQAMRRNSVPLWIALLLKKQGRCNIVPPEWLSESALKKTYEMEAQNMSRFSNALPWEWIEIGETILASAPDDLTSPPHVIRNLMRDVREIRQAKIRAGVRDLNDMYIQLDHVGAMELNEARPFVTFTMNQLRSIRQAVGDVEDDEESDEDNETDDDDEKITDSNTVTMET